MSKHKKEHRWVIVKNGAALMTYEYVAFFFTDDGDNVYYNQITNDAIDIWSLAYKTKRDAETVLKDFKSLYEKQKLDNPEYTQEEIDNWGTKYQTTLPNSLCPVLVRILTERMLQRFIIILMHNLT